VDGKQRVFFVPLDSDVNALNLVYPELLAGTEDEGRMPQTWEEMADVAEKWACCRYFTALFSWFLLLFSVIYQIHP
jgi:hypothetical protein